MGDNFSIKPSDIAFNPESTNHLRKSDNSFILNTSAKQSRGGFLNFLPFNNISNKDVVFFSREFSILLNASVPIVDSLKILSNQTANPRFRQVILEITASIESGNSLSTALASYPKVFNNLFISLVKTGEVSGTLDKALTYIADQYEKDYNLRRKVKGALTYPVFVVGAMVVVLGLLFTYVMPRMLAMLTETNAVLPITTRILIMVTSILSNYWWLFLALIVGLVLTFRYVVAKPGGRLWWDGAKLKLPVMGPVLQKVYIERFSRNFAILVKGGVPIVSGLKITAAAIGNTLYKKILEEVAGQVENGRSLAEGLTDYPDQMPPLVTQMVDVGEKTSKTDEILFKIAGFYEREAEASIGAMTQLLEPVVMLILGAMVAVIVSGILLPIYNLVAAQ